jgi:hypothetical protein
LLLLFFVVAVDDDDAAPAALRITQYSGSQSRTTKELVRSVFGINKYQLQTFFIIFNLI